MRDSTPIAVTSRSFSRHPVLRAELLQRYENVTFNEDGKALAGETLVAFLGGHAKAITALEVIDDTLLAQVSELRVISKVGVGLDMIDLDALGRRGVRQAWTPGTNRRSVSELVIALALALLRHVVPSVLEVRGGMWRQQQGRTLSGRTVGVLVLGHVGQDLVRLLGPFECRVLAQDIREWPEFEAEHRVTRVDLETFLRESDVVSVHLPLTEETRNILSAERLARMKMGAILINTARGNLVDEGALAALLRSGRLAGAGFDVFAMEPPGDRDLLALPNFLATPHIAGSTEEAILAMGRAAIAGLDAAVRARSRPGR